MKFKISIASQLIVLSLLVILSGCVIPEPPAPTPTVTPTPSTQAELSLKIGETAKLQVIEVMVISVNRTDSVFTYTYFGSKTKELRESSTESVFVLAEVEIKNTGENGIKFMGVPFKMIDSAGFIHSDYFADYEERFKKDDLYPNNTRRGKILFEIPREAKGLKIELDRYSLNTPDFKAVPIGVKSVSWSLE